MTENDARILGWPDSSPGVRALKEKAIVVALSNGNMRFLVDLVSGPPLLSPHARRVGSVLWC